MCDYGELVIDLQGFTNRLSYRKDRRFFCTKGKFSVLSSIEQKDLGQDARKLDIEGRNLI